MSESVSECNFIHLSFQIETSVLYQTWNLNNVIEWNANFSVLVKLVNWRFVHAVVIAAIQSHISGDQPTMQYSFKPKEFTIIHDLSQKTALNIDEL